LAEAGKHGSILLKVDPFEVLVSRAHFGIQKVAVVFIWLLMLQNGSVNRTASIAVRLFLVEIVEYITSYSMPELRK
jgi:hypothetical protein